MIKDRAKLDRYLDLVAALTQKELRVRYKSYALGYMWSLAQPIAFSLVFYFAFKVALRVPMENYVFFLLSGLFPWQWIANSVNSSPMNLVNNASIIKKVAFPRHAIIVSNVLQDLIHFLLAIPIITVVGLVYHRSPTLMWLIGIPVLLVLQLALIVGLALILSSVNLFFRDMERLTMLMMTLLFYFTPVVYSIQQIPEHFRPFLMLNPAAPLMVGWRTLFMQGALDLTALAWGAGHAFLFLTVGSLIYRRLAPKFAEVL
jgi:lipopolysaccharide transport system permease protein